MADNSNQFLAVSDQKKYCCLQQLVRTRASAGSVFILHEWNVKKYPCLRPEE